MELYLVAQTVLVEDRLIGYLELGRQEYMLTWDFTRMVWMSMYYGILFTNHWVEKPLTDIWVLVRLLKSATISG